MAIDPNPVPNLSFVLKAPRKGIIEDGPVPLIRSRTDVIIRIYSRELSASDVTLWRNGPGNTYKGHVPGLHAAGVVSMVGPGCKTLKVGDRVVFSPMHPCRTCIFCKSGVHNLCPQRKMTGIPPFNGTLSKFCVVPEDLCVTLPDSIGFEEGALIGSYSIAFHVCRRANIQPGYSVVVFGENACAYFCAAVARTFGATKVYVVGKGFHPDIQFSDTPRDIAKDIIRKYELYLGANTVIEASGIDAFVSAGVHVLRSGGTYVQLYSNLYGYERPVSFPIRLACTKELVIRGSCGSLPEDFRTSIEMLESGKLSMKKIENVYEFEDAQLAFEKAQKDIEDANSVFRMADPSFFINGPRDV